MKLFKCHAYFNDGKKDINVTPLGLLGKEKAVSLSILHSFERLSKHAGVDRKTKLMNAQMLLNRIGLYNAKSQVQLVLS